MTIGIHSHHLQDGIDDGAWSANPAAADPPDSSLGAMANATAPVMNAAATLAQTLYLTEPGTANPISVSDINQGQLGDCFLLSPLGEEALFHPGSISNMIHNNGNGTETVTLYIDRGGRLPTFASAGFKATTVTISNSFSAASVDNGPQQDVLGSQKEIWPQVVEKAVATLNGGYSAIANGGYPVLAMEELTGRAASWMSPAVLTLATLQNYVAAGDLITMDTASTGRLPDGLVNGHCYMFDKLNGSGGSASVQLLNPWGFDQPSAIPLTQLARAGIVEVDIGHTG